MSRTFTITVNDKQESVIRAALELYRRVLMGQWDCVIMPEMEMEDRHKCSRVLSVISETFGQRPSHGGYWGIGSPEIHDNARTAWDIQQVMRYHEAWDRMPEGGMQVIFDKPMKYDSKNPLPKVEISKDAD